MIQDESSGCGKKLVFRLIIFYNNGERDSSLFDFGANLEYLFRKNLGLDLLYMYFEDDMEKDRDNMVSHLDYKYLGVKLYCILHF